MLLNLTHTKGTTKMELLMLLDLVSGLNEEEKEKVLNEEYQRQHKFVNALCDVKRAVLSATKKGGE